MSDIYCVVLNATHHETGYGEGDAGEVDRVLLHEREPHDEAVVRPDLRHHHRVLRRAVSQVRLAAARRNLEKRRRQFTLVKQIRLRENVDFWGTA